MDKRLEEKNIIVFDIGNVLLRFDKNELGRHFFSDEEREPMLDAMFGSGLWPLIDTGLLSTGTLARMMYEAGHFTDPSAFLKISDFLDRFPEYMEQLEPSKWLPELKAAGKKLYYLTNYASPQLEKTIARNPFFSFFDGGIVSAHEHIVKPAPRIFRILCERYGFCPEDALFIDDTLPNVQAAERLGFSVWHYTGTRTDR